MNLNNTSTSFPILSNSTNSLNLFNNFNGHQFPFDYLILQIILFLFTLISIFMNSIIVGTTIYSNQLKEHCHMLIATESGCNALLQFNRWIPFFLALTDINFISLYKCFWLQILPLFVSLIGTGLILVIGIERLICIAFPLWLA
uniref:G_PROTEIN_RECEP_F1_2 domain-containing protein n=1 Tax=Meloidogyne hapla TaxID=6305 RepID=A0A1I8C3C1_MELHA